MKCATSYTDDNGVEWKVRYDEITHYEQDESGAPVRDDNGSLMSTTHIENLAYRKEGDDAWLSLPPWATVRDGPKITFCFFDEDDDTGDLTFWEVKS